MPTALRRRIERLERRFMVEIRQPSVAHRLIVRGMVEPLNLENSTYQQVPWGADAVVECILLEGCPDDSTQAELDAWIARQAAASHLARDSSVRRTIGLRAKKKGTIPHVIEVDGKPLQDEP